MMEVDHIKKIQNVKLLLSMTLQTIMFILKVKLKDAKDEEESTWAIKYVIVWKKIDGHWKIFGIICKIVTNQNRGNVYEIYDKIFEIVIWKNNICQQRTEAKNKPILL
jgi:hypothetical protein